MSVDDAWKETNTMRPSHLYEVLAGPCEVYLDVEWKCTDKPENEISVVQKIVEFTKEKLKNLYTVQVSSCEATASGFTADGAYKCSWHINFKTPGVMWASAKHVGDFVRRHLSTFAYVDPVPYNAPKQNWRCVGSSKCSEPKRVLGPSCKKKFLSCIVQQDCTGAQIVGCRESIPVQLQLCESAKAVINQFENVRPGASHMSLANSRFLIIPFVSKFCCIAKRTHRSNHQYAVVDMKCMRWKYCCHNSVCKQKLQIWQPMPNFAAAKILLPPCAPVRIPQIQNIPVTPCLTVRARGPPPASMFSSSVRFIQCSNGTFHLPCAL